MREDFEQFAAEVQSGLNADVKEAFDTFGTFVPANQGWEEPIPFDSIDTPHFPVDCLPGPMAAFVKALAETTQTADEMAGILSLGVLSTAFQSRYIVEITPDWWEPLCLFCMAVAPPAERKSAVISALTGPIREYEAERQQQEAVAIRQNQDEKDMLEKSLQAAKMTATSAKVDAGKREVARLEALNISAQLAEYEDMHPFRLLADDCTVEKLVDIMGKQNGSLTICSSEGGIFDAMCGRYDKTLNIDVYLKGHAGETITVDRINRAGCSIPNARLTLLLTVQPDVMTGVLTNDAFRGRGLCGRFLYAVCKSKMGHRKVSPDPIPTDVKDNYKSFIHKILDDDNKGTIRLSPEANEVRAAYQGYIEKKLGNSWIDIQDWGGKVTGAMVRIAALIHCAETEGNPTEIPISSDEMIAATNIAEFLCIHAEAAFMSMGADKDQEIAKYVLKRIIDQDTNAISKRDIHRLCKGKKGLEHTSDIEPALDILIDMGYLREGEDGPTGGRPTKTLLVNPYAKSVKRAKRAG